MATDLYRHPQWSPGTSILFDHRNLDTAGLIADDIHAISDIVKNAADQLGNGRCAVVVGRTVDYGLARMWEIMTQNGVSLKIGIFYSMDEARQWIQGANPD